MVGYLARRLASGFLVLLAVSILVFAMVHLTPGDPVQRIMYRAKATPQEIEAMRHWLGLDRPLVVQYLMYIGRLFRGDMGVSIYTRRPISQEIGRYAGATLELTLAGMTVAALPGLALGIIAGARRGSWIEAAATALSSAGVSVPDFWLSILLILVFSVHLGWLPSMGSGGLSHLILPSIALGAGYAAIITRLTRGSLVEVLRENYITVARAKGLSERVVVYRHALKNAMIPVISMMGLQFGNMLGGAVVVETVFARKGLGSWLVHAILQKDYPAVQGAVLMFAAVYVVLSMLVDLSYTVLDPRIQVG